ncbi:MAG: PH domain-containing protein [Eggerthellaceae bacterium]|nr:PH domain-containing protein [Eggerthellaceae bacterium]
MSGRKRPREKFRGVRVHHSYIWLNGIESAGIIFIALVLTILSAVEEVEVYPFERAEIIDEIYLTIGALIALLVILIIYRCLRYYFLWYELGDEEFSVHSGILIKKRVHVPYVRIQSIDQTASLLQRVFGVCDVAVDTAGGATNKAVRIPYLAKSQAEILRTELFRRKQYMASAGSTVALGFANPSWPYPQKPVSEEHNVLDAPSQIWDQLGGVFAGDKINTGRVTYEYGLTNGQLFLAGLSNTGTGFLVAIVTVIVGIVQIMSTVVTVFPRRSSAVISLISQITSRVSIQRMVIYSVIAILVIALIVWFVHAIGTCISYGGFKGRRRNDRIEVEHGLFRHQFQGVNVERVQSIVIRQGFIRRLMGYCEVSFGKIDAVGGSDAGNRSADFSTNGFMVHPFIKMKNVPELLENLIPEYSGVPRNVTKIAPVALRRGLIRRCIIQGTGFWLAVIVFIVRGIVAGALWRAYPGDFDMITFVNDIANFFFLIALVVFIFEAIGTILWARESSFAVNDRFMQVSNSGFTRETTSFPRKKIQFGYTKTNPFQRRAKTATIHAVTAAGIGGTTIRLIDVRQSDAKAWLDWIKPYHNLDK